jgi:hypothetical protein
LQGWSIAFKPAQAEPMPSGEKEILDETVKYFNPS